MVVQVTVCVVSCSQRLLPAASCLQRGLQVRGAALDRCSSPRLRLALLPTPPPPAAPDHPRRCRSFFTIRDVLALYPALGLRLFLLSTQYRQAVNYTQRALEEVGPQHHAQLSPNNDDNNNDDYNIIQYI